ncbi:hypothetical protein BDW02DRAFT_328745 [Decorospora gaudefroyi]|uniref:Uncharacterized protein n=1 Tax=Decorospora gaudefroyi TaxID=184978 RepID=A0A6A5KB36_9PLEO|nr:hypothetical protein BDW02DRAFT_328745 [Decorospora gaudefroyi]
MYFAYMLSAVGTIFLATSTSASPVSLNDGAMSKDWSHVFSSGISMASKIGPGAQMASISVAGGFPAHHRVSGHVWNRCPYSIYVRLTVAEFTSNPDKPPETDCPKFGDYPEEEIKPGEAYHSPVYATPNQCGHVIKVGRKSFEPNVYQVEYSVDGHTGYMWYNLSAEDGAPFQDVLRYLAGVPAKGTCPFVYCAPGHWGKDPVHGCDWPLQPMCTLVGSVVAVLCGTAGASVP